MLLSSRFSDKLHELFHGINQAGELMYLESSIITRVFQNPLALAQHDQVKLTFDPENALIELH